MPENTSKGVWIDTKNRKVVEGKEPEEGVQLAAPGAEVTPHVQASIDAARKALEVDTATAPDVDTATAPDVETATEREPVSTATAPKKRARRKS